MSSVRATGQVEGDNVVGVHAEWETAASAKSGDHPGSALPCTPFRFRLRRIPFGLTKETFPTALDGLLVDPNMIEVSVANHKNRD